MFFFSIIVFFFIYFLAPEVSMRFFGIAFRQEEYVERSLEDAIVDMGIPEEEARGIVASLDSEEMRALVKKYGLCDMCDFTGLNVSAAKLTGCTLARPPL